MTFHEYVEAARTRYLDFYRKQLAELRAAQSALASELLIKPGGATNPEPFCLMRVDAVFQENGEYKFVRVAMNDEAPSGTHAPGPGPTFEVGALRVATSADTALSWEALTVSFRSPNFAIGTLHDWLTKWLDVGEIRKPDEETGLAGVVHSIGWNQPEGEGTGSWEIAIDFGSAPVDALLELLQIIEAHNVREVLVDTRGEGA